MTAQEIHELLKDFQVFNTHEVWDTEAIIELAKRLPTCPTILETGTKFAKGACAWALVTGGTVYTIEHKIENKEQIERNIKSVGLENRVFPIYGDSTTVAWNKTVDVVWLDSGHHADTIIKELIKYSQFAKCLICGHDYGHELHPEVKTTIDAWFGAIDKSPNANIWYKFL